MTLDEAKTAYQEWASWYTYALAHPDEIPVGALAEGKQHMVDALHTYTSMVQANVNSAVATATPGAPALPKVVAGASGSNPFTDAIPDNIKMVIGIALAAAALYMIFTGKKK